MKTSPRQRCSRWSQALINLWWRLAWLDFLLLLVTSLPVICTYNTVCIADLRRSVIILQLWPRNNTTWCQRRDNEHMLGSPRNLQLQKPRWLGKVEVPVWTVQTGVWTWQRKQSSTSEYTHVQYGGRCWECITSTNITKADWKKYETVVSKFDEFFQVRQIIIYKRARFNGRNGESAKQYINALY